MTKNASMTGDSGRVDEVREARWPNVGLESYKALIYAQRR